MQQWLTRWAQFVSGKRTRWVTIVIWVLLVSIFSIIWPQVNSQETNTNQLLPEHVMSVEADQIIEEQFSDGAGMPLLLVWHRESGLNETDFKHIQSVYKALEEDPVVKQEFVPPLSEVPVQALEGSASEDGKALLTPVVFDPEASADDFEQALNEITTIVTDQIGQITEENLSDNSLHLRFTGPVGIQTDTISLFSNADVTLLIATILIVLILLVVLYRSPILAIVPLIAVSFAYGFVNPLLGTMAQRGWIEVDAQAVSIMTVLLFGAGTDYCLFMISR